MEKGKATQEMYLPVLRCMPIWPRRSVADSEYFYSRWA